MRKCLRCETAMVEDLAVMVTNGGYGVDVREKGMFKSSLGKIKCAAEHRIIIAPTNPISCHTIPNSIFFI